MSELSELKLVGAELCDGETTRLLCPFCGGGSSKEMSLCMTREGDSLVYICHRASCGTTGCIGERPLLHAPRAHPKEQRSRQYDGELMILPDEWKKYLSERLGFTDWHFSVSGAMLAPEEWRVAYPIYDPMGRRRGWVLRSYEENDRWKALTYPEEDCHLSYYRPNYTSSCVVVEDQPSAVRASRYVDAVAMCGGGIGIDYAREIAAHFTDVTWAFDADATVKAFEHHRRFALLFEHSRVMPLDMDLKDMGEEELCMLLGGQGE